MMALAILVFVIDLLVVINIVQSAIRPATKAGWIFAVLLLPMQPVPLADVPMGTVLRVVGAAGAGFPSPAQDWEDDAISLIELLPILGALAWFLSPAPQRRKSRWR